MPVDFEQRGNVALITLNRPDKMNAIDAEMRLDLQNAWKRLSSSPDIRAAVITGAGDRAFCAGADLSRPATGDKSFAEQAFGEGDFDHLLKNLDTDTPIIAAIRGYAIGGGMELALACDIRIASESAQFALAEVRHGTIPGGGGTQTLPRAIPRSAAMYMLLTGDRIGSDQALQYGLVSEVCPDEATLDRAMEIAERIAQNGPLAVRAAKRLVKMGTQLSLPDALALEKYVWGNLRDSRDRAEGRAAFREKRQPVFEGR